MLYVNAKQPNPSAEGIFEHFLRDADQTGYNDRPLLEGALRISQRLDAQAQFVAGYADTPLNMVTATFSFPSRRIQASREVLTPGLVYMVYLTLDDRLALNVAQNLRLADGTDIVVYHPSSEIGPYTRDQFRTAMRDGTYLLDWEATATSIDEAIYLNSQVERLQSRAILDLDQLIINTRQKVSFRSGYEQRIREQLPETPTRLDFVLAFARIGKDKEGYLGHALAG